MKSKVMILGVMAVILMAGSVFACGPFFDDAYLVRGSGQNFLSMPDGSFQYELEKISGNTKKPQMEKEDEYHALRDKTASADIDDLKEAMKSSHAPELQKAKAIDVYEERRSKITEYLKAYIPINPWRWYGDQFRSPEKGAIGWKLSKGSESELTRLIPKEFLLYMDGAIAYHNEDLKGAIKKWQELLSLPKDQCKYRSVWASFMVGKAYLYMHNNKESIPYFEMARKLAAEEYKDSLNLAQESYGWQALAEFELGQYAASMNHYLPRVDTISLDLVCTKVASINDTEFENVVKDDIARRILIGWVVSQSSYYFYTNNENTDYIKIATRLLQVIEKDKLNIPLESADRIAWMFYNLGDFQKADKWLNVPQEKSALSEWLRAKLLIRNGELDKAIEKINSLKYAFEKNAEWKIFSPWNEQSVDRVLNTEQVRQVLKR